MKKSGRIFCIPQVYFTKSCQQIWVCVNQPFHRLSDVMFKNILLIIFHTIITKFIGKEEKKRRGDLTETIGAYERLGLLEL